MASYGFLPAQMLLLSIEPPISRTSATCVTVSSPAAVTSRLTAVGAAPSELPLSFTTKPRVTHEMARVKSTSAPVTDILEPVAAGCESS